MNYDFSDNIVWKYRYNLIILPTLTSLSSKTFKLWSIQKLGLKKFQKKNQNFKVLPFKKLKRYWCNILALCIFYITKHFCEVS